jgi:hypothetical protein
MWAVAGSRRLPPGGSAAVAAALAALGPVPLAVGCCMGADGVVLGCVPTPRLRVFAAFGPDGQGACALSAVSAVCLVAATGAAVTWWAGGGPAVPLAARLARRTRAVMGAATSGLLLFPASPASRGSWLAARLAVAQGLPVVAVPLGFPPSALPALGPGRWAASPAFPGGWAWRPAPGLFDGA